jgi:alginate O-acetyltransferase complex protein AlgI
VLFTTAAFICIFLPIVLIGFFGIGRFSHPAAALWLFVASVFFYGYWMPEFTLLLLASISGNFLVGKKISSLANADDERKRRQAKGWMVFGVAANLTLLGYFKYANFFVDNFNVATGSSWHIGRVILPIGISFFSFTQIAFLADAWRKGIREYRFVHYGLFVSYFPHLIAGPVLHHAQMMPQFRDAATYRFNSGNFSAGLAIFALGMFKKVVLADGISPYADAIFKAADQGVSPDFAGAWLGAMAYTLQLYFDFSGYSDMAIGLSWMLNVRLPFNFNSPYQATNISDFWRRWHMSLSQFLRDYLYIGLGGKRKGPARRYVNLMVTMVLGGLWHGAGWSFVVWGTLHGLYLGVNHAFRALCGPALCARLDRSRLFGVSSWLLTMLAVIVAWVVFRAETLQGAGRILQRMVQPSDTGPVHALLWNAGLSLSMGGLWCAVLTAMACLAPNSNAIGEYLLRRCRTHAGANPYALLVAGASSAAVAFLLLMNITRDSVSAFIYFNF